MLQRRSVLTGEIIPPTKVEKLEKWDHAKELDAAIARTQPVEASVAAPAVVTRPAPSPFLKGFEEMPTAPSPPPGATAVERLTYPPGLLGHATDRAFHSTDLPDRQIALWGAMVGLAKILDRRLIGPTGSSSVLYNLLVAATGVGKEPALQFSLTLLRAAGPSYERLLQGGFLASAQAVEDMVRVTPNCLAMIDEFGSWFKMIQDQSGNVSQLPMVLCKLWGQKPRGRYPVLRRANRDAKEEDLTFIQWPTMALAGATISEPFWDACGDDHISGGFLNRCLLLDAGLGAMEYVTPTYEPDDIPEWMINLIRIGAKSAQPSQGSLPIMTGYLAPWQQSWEPRGEEAYRDRRSDIRRLPEGHRRSLSIRTHEMAIRYASVVALWCGSLRVSDAHFEWAWAHAAASRDMVLKGANENLQVKRDFKAVCDHIKHLLADGPMRWMDIRAKSRSAGGQYGMEIVDKAVAELLDCGEIRELPFEEQVERGLRSAMGTGPDVRATGLATRGTQRTR